MNVATIFEPHPGPQTDFASFAGRYALFGGAANCGKTELLRFDPFRQIAVETERVANGEIASSTGWCLYLRRTMPQLREVMSRCVRDFERVDPGVKWNEKTSTYIFSCGYRYTFGHMEHEDDWANYQGYNFSEIIFDELTQFTENQFDMLDVWLRSTDPVLLKMLYMRAGTNPIGVGIDWVRKRFVEVAPAGKQVVRRVKTPVFKGGQWGQEIVEQRQLFVPSRVYDNPSVDQAQYASTLVTKSGARRRALLEGDWYAVEGAWVGDLWDSSVHVVEPYKVPRSVYVFRSGDYGHANYSSINWWAVDFDETMTCIRELYVKGHDAEMLAYRIKEAELEMGYWDVFRGGSMLTGPLDAQCWAKMGTIGPTIAETMMDVGVHWHKSTKDRPNAAAQFKMRLRRRAPHPTLKDKAGKPQYIIPGIRWFKSCKAAIRTIPSLPCDDLDTEVPDSKAEDHAWDSAAYACMARPLVPERRVGDRDIDFFMQDEIEAARRAKQRQGIGQRSGYPGGW